MTRAEIWKAINDRKENARRIREAIASDILESRKDKRDVRRINRNIDNLLAFEEETAICEKLLDGTAVAGFNGGVQND